MDTPASSPNNPPVAPFRNDAAQAEALQMSSRLAALDSRHVQYQHIIKPDGTEGFVKVGCDPDADEHIQRELWGHQVALAAGVPSPALLGYRMAGGHAVITTAWLSPEEGTLLMTAEDVARANPILGAQAAMTLWQFGAQPIPPGVDSTALERDDYRLRADWFAERWHALVEDLLADPITAECVDVLAFAALLQAVHAEGQPLIDANEIPRTDQRYLAHGDCDPRNFYFPNGERTASYLDWQDALVTANPALALLVDLSNFYAVSGRNLALQAAFIETWVTQAQQEGNDAALTILRLSMAFGTIFLTPWTYQVGHQDLPLQQQLLTSLAANLAKVPSVTGEVRN